MKMMHAKKFNFINKFWTYFIIAVGFMLLLISIAVVSGVLPKSYAEESNGDNVWTIVWDETQKVDKVRIGETITVPIFAAQPKPGQRFLYKWKWELDEKEIILNTYETITPSDIWDQPDEYHLSPMFEKIVYDVVLNATNGAFSDGNWKKLEQIKYGEEFDSITDNLPHRWGYKFLGFFKDTSFNSKRYIKPDGTPDAPWDQETLNPTIYAHWRNAQFNVTLDANGGSFSGKSTFPMAVSEYVEPLSENQIPIKDGSTFLGYFDEPEGGKLYFDSYGNFCSPTWTSDYGNKNITLYAHWTQSIIKINLSSEGVTTIHTPIIYEKYGVGWFSDESCESEKEISKIEVPERKDHDFKGYYYNNEMLINDEGNIVGDPTIFDLDTTLYALWKGDIFEVVIPREGLGLAIYEKYGDGWYDNAQCTGQKITAIDTVPSDACNDFDGYYFNNVKIIDSEGKISEDSCSLTLNAKLKESWVPKVFTINLNPGEGFSEPGTKVIYEKYGVGWFKDKECTETFDGNKIEIPTKEESSFMGYWFNDSENSTRIISADGTIVATNKFFKDPNNVSASWTNLQFFEICLDAGKDATTLGTQVVFAYLHNGWFADPERKHYIDQIHEIPTRYGYLFGGYYLNDQLVIDSKGHFIKEALPLFTKNETLNAKWVPQRSWITLDKNGGSGGPNQLTVLYGSELQALLSYELPEKEGFCFEGYFDISGYLYINADGTPTRVWDKNVESVTLYAHWHDIVKVTLNAGEDVAPDKRGTSVIYEKYGEGWYSDDQCKDKLVCIDAPVKDDIKASFEGYFFENKQIISSDGQITAAADELTTDVQLDAVWKNDVIKVTLGTETETIDIWEKYGSGWYNSEECTDRIFKIPYIPTKNCYYLDGFYYNNIQIIDSDGTIKVDSKTFTSSTRLDAVWLPKIYTIKLEAGYGASHRGTEYIYEKYGVGWYSTIDCKVPAIKYIDPPKSNLKFLSYRDWHNNNVVITNNGWIDVQPTYFTESTTLYADWDINSASCKVSLNSGDAKTPGTTAIYTKNEGKWYSDPSCITEIFQIDIPTKKGYIFEGYYYDLVQYINEEGFIVYKDLKLAGDVELFAAWKATTSDVFLNKQGGEGGPDSFSATYDKPTPSLKQADIPTKEGYIFEGYYDSASGGNMYINKDGSSSRIWDKIDKNVTLYAHWSPIICKITLNAGSGVQKAGTDCIYEKYNEGWFLEESCTEQSKIDQIICPEKSGTEFCGYYLGNTPILNSEGKIVCDSTTFKKDTELFALWTGSLIGISLMLDIGSMSIWEKYGVGWYKDITCKEEITQIDPPTKAGYNFEGYFYNGDKIIDKNGLIAVDNKKFVAPATLTPTWSPKVFQIKLDPGEDCSKFGTTVLYEKFGVGWFSNSSCTEAEKISNIDCPEKPNMKFLGYKNQNTPYLTYSTGQIVCSNTYFKDDTTINALWGDISIYEIELNAGKDVTEVGTQVIYNKNGQGWYSDHECTEPIFSIVCPNKTGYTFTGYYHDSKEIISKDGIITGDASLVSSRLSLNASWNANTYTVKLNKNGGVGGVSEINATYGLKMLPIKSADLPRRTGYSFDGYFDSAEGGVQYIDKDGISIIAWDRTDTNPELFAHWSLNKFRVELNFNGGSGSVDSVEATYSQPMPTLKQGELPTKDGFGFLGYFDDINGGIQYYAQDGTSTHNWDKLSSSTLYAHWIKIENTVSLWGKAYTNDGIPLSEVLVVYQNDFTNVMFSYMTGSDGQYKLDYLPKGQPAKLSFYKEGYLSLNVDLTSEYMSSSHFDCDVEIDEAVRLTIIGSQYHKIFECTYIEDDTEKFSEEIDQFDKLISLGTKITCTTEGIITVYNEDYNTKIIIKAVPIDGFRFEQFAINGIPLYSGQEYLVDKQMDLAGVVSYVPISPVPTPTPEDINATITGENIVATSDNVALFSIILMCLTVVMSSILVRKMRIKS